MSKRGIVQVYTGNGKGKTTAALGQALRAVGHGWQVKMFQFMKGNPNYGEIQAARWLPGLVIVQCGRDEFVNADNPESVDVKLAREGLEMARREIAGGGSDMVVLDEINVACAFGLLETAAVLEVVRSRPPWVDLILTGRYAPPEIVAVADLVSEVQDTKHHYYQGVAAREGIEF
ncbi:MAG: cob(I)yrinic acid a,c-diamide adenosyltransferase [Clostridia bacterium]|nr:MAG: cob(I)yrinic acid a,c-diamide adenosyltransferase [Clostridia bacterium]